MLGPYSQQCVDARELLTISEENLVAIIDGVENRLITNDGFFSVGLLDLSGVSVSGAMKTRLGGGSAYERWANEVFLADKVISKSPETQNAFPLLTLPVCELDNDWWKGLGILTEDFTEGGKKVLYEYEGRRYRGKRISRDLIIAQETRSALELCVYEALNGRVNPEAFAHMAGFVGTREVMIDFDDVDIPSQEDLKPYIDLAHELVVAIDI